MFLIYKKLNSILPALESVQTATNLNLPVSNELTYRRKLVEWDFHEDYDASTTIDNLDLSVDNIIKDYTRLCVNGLSPGEIYNEQVGSGIRLTAASSLILGSTNTDIDLKIPPSAAEIAAEIVEKVRINPGNYADKKKFQQIEYDDRSYND